MTRSVGKIELVRTEQKMGRGVGWRSGKRSKWRTCLKRNRKLLGVLIVMDSRTWYSFKSWWNRKRGRGGEVLLTVAVEGVYEQRFCPSSLYLFLR